LASSGVPALDQLLGDGYPDRSSILLTGQPGIGKEALGYWFIRSGLIQGDYCLFVTHMPVGDVLKDMKAYGVSTDRVPDWFAGSGSPTLCDLTDHTSISFNVKQAVDRNRERRIRIFTDIVSPLLIMNSQPTMYQYWSSLIRELKQRECVILATAEEGMHPASTITALEQQFDGVIEMRLYEEGLSLTPLLRIRKMLGLQPQQGYFNFSFTKSGIEVMPHAK
jgi:circadian clock protein KaiC